MSEPMIPTRDDLRLAVAWISAQLDRDQEQVTTIASTADSVEMVRAFSSLCVLFMSEAAAARGISVREFVRLLQYGGIDELLDAIGMDK